MFLTRSDTSLHDRALSVCYSCYFDHPALVTCWSCVSREFRHCISGMAVLIFLYSYIRNNFPFDHILRIGDRTFIYRQAFAKSDRFTPEGTCNCKFIVSHRCCRRLKARADLNCRIYSDTDRDWQTLSKLFCSFCHCSDVACTRCKENR